MKIFGKILAFECGISLKNPNSEFLLTPWAFDHFHRFATCFNEKSVVGTSKSPQTRIENYVIASSLYQTIRDESSLS
jgi:hypothetical protein